MAARGVFRSVAKDRAVLAIVVVAIAAGAWLAHSRFGPSAPVARLRLSAGRPQGPRHAMAEALAIEAKKRGVHVLLVPSAGSGDALDRLESGQIDAAMVQGGLELAGRGHARQVAALHVEPLHLLVKKELRDDAARGLDALRGRAVSLGEPGSGTRALASAVMRFARMEPGRDFRDASMSYDQLESAPAGAGDRLPDAVFMVSLLPSRVAKALVSRHDYRLVPLPFGEAFSLDGLSSDGGPSPPEAPRDAIRREDVIDAAIPAFTYGIRPAVPPETVPTMGARMLLVAPRRRRPGGRVPADRGRLRRPVRRPVPPSLAAQVARPPLGRAAASRHARVSGEEQARGGPAT